ncbi:MAG TPA: uracil-DNA glycosylase [Candidatus Nanoarchaeia archaeon]|nr:uracil-DNA glycosylase [Candidatus Nanoarchaeia archaeon]
MGEGNSQSGIMLIGQNPGETEEKLGRPFVGRTGRFLDKVFAEHGIDRKNLYITSVVKCRTQGNRKPSPAEVKSCLPILTEEIKNIKPKVIVLMGKVAQGIPRLSGIDYIETVHPTAAMRFPKYRKKFMDDIAKLESYL